MILANGSDVATLTNTGSNAAVIGRDLGPGHIKLRDMVVSFTALTTLIRDMSAEQKLVQVAPLVDIMDKPEATEIEGAGASTSASVAGDAEAQLLAGAVENSQMEDYSENTQKAMFSGFGEEVADL